MEAATANLLTALYALSHRVALTGEDLAEVERRGRCLTPGLWRATRDLLREADRGGAGTRMDLGFTPLVLRWLGFADEGGFVRAHGLGVEEALAAGRGALGVLAHTVEGRGGAGPGEVRLLVGEAWRARAVRLNKALPENAEAVAEALERALDGCPWPEEHRRRLLVFVETVSRLLGDEARAGAARRERKALGRKAPVRDRPEPVHEIAATLLSVLWCVTNDERLLTAERALDPEVERSPGAWARARAAIEAGRAGDLPLPVETFAAWGAGPELDEETLRACLAEGVRARPEMARVVELAWAREDPDEDVCRETARCVVAAAVRRRQGVEHAYRPLPGVRRGLFHEVHQGARRPEALERAALVKDLHTVLARAGGVDPFAVASVYLDLAAESESRGNHEEARRLLAAAAERAREVDDDPERREYADALLADWHRRAGEIGEAVRRLDGLQGHAAAKVRTRIDDNAPEREALREAERRSERGDLGSACGHVLAEARAGHEKAAERLARALCESSPEAPGAFATLASVLLGLGRYRDAIEPARAALEAGADPLGGAVLLAKALSGAGPEAREESAALAARAIEGHGTGGALTSAELADAALIAHQGGASLGLCRRGDDHVRSLSATDPPPAGWLGAAASRRCHGVWAGDAPEWLSMLAGVEPAQLARFVVERVEALQHARLLAGRALLGTVEGLQDERAICHRARKLIEERHGGRLCELGGRRRPRRGPRLGRACPGHRGRVREGTRVAPPGERARASEALRRTVRRRARPRHRHRGPRERAGGLDPVGRGRAGHVARRPRARGGGSDRHRPAARGSLRGGLPGRRRRDPGHRLAAPLARGRAPVTSDARALAAALGARAEEVCRALLPRGRRAGRYWTVGGLDGAPGRSMWVRLRPPGRPGRWVDAATGEHGDLLDLVAHRLGAGSLGPALEEARALLALPPAPCRHAHPPPRLPGRTHRCREAGVGRLAPPRPHPRRSVPSRPGHRARRAPRASLPSGASLPVRRDAP